MESREEIEKIVRRTVACEELFRLENIEVTEEEFKAEVVKAKEEFERYGTEYDVQKLVEQAGETIDARKSVEWLRANASGRQPARRVERRGDERPRPSRAM